MAVDKEAIAYRESTHIVLIIVIIMQPLCPVVERRPQHAVSKLRCELLLLVVLLNN